MPVAFWAALGKDANYGISAWNDAAERLYGVHRQDAIGQSFLDLFVQPFARDHAASECDSVISGTYEHPSNCIAFDRRVDGSELLLLTNVFRLQLEDNVYQAEISVDLTSTGFSEFIDSDYRKLFIDSERHSEVKQLSFLIKYRLEKEREEVNRWAAGLVHDIRSDVGAALDHFISYQRRWQAQSDDRDLVHAEYFLRSLAERVDTFVGVFGGQRRGVVQDFDGVEVFDSELSRLTKYGPEVFRTSVECLEQPARRIRLHGRPESFRQCVYNLMRNACVHMRPSPGEPRVIIVSAKVDSPARSLVITLSNPGTLDAMGSISDRPVDRISLGLKLIQALTEEAGGKLLLEERAAEGEDGANSSSVVARLTWPLAQSARAWGPT